ncbi:MAG: Uma2 family endonuclease [candidate division NC10 bacterium]|nr:Uma2 family endonuclease [candidate division NC10 bacterium]
MTVHVKFTYDDYLLFPDDGRRHELIDGEHYMTPSPSERHQRISFNITHHIATHLDERPLGRLYAAPFDVVLSKTDVVQPDLLFVSSARSSILTAQNVQGAPALIVEILSETTRKTDEIVKRKLYERFGVQEYWIVDPELETIKVYRTTGQGYQRVAELSCETGDTLTTPLLPDLTLPLSKIFE